MGNTIRLAFSKVTAVGSELIEGESMDAGRY